VSFSRHGIQHDWKDTISGVHVHVSPGSAETLVRRGGIANHHLIAYYLSNISAKNYRNRFMCVEVIVYNINVVFWDTELMDDCSLFSVVRFGIRCLHDGSCLRASVECRPYKLWWTGLPVLEDQCRLKLEMWQLQRCIAT